jgi:hypothetical protein
MIKDIINDIVSLIFRDSRPAQSIVPTTHIKYKSEDTASIKAMTDVVVKEEVVVDDNSSDDASIIESLAERLRFFFSNANLRQDRWR